MYISMVCLDKRKHETAQALYNRNILHGAIEQCFEGDRQHPLWRIDNVNGRLYVMVVSHDIPDFTSFMQQFGDFWVSPQTKAYDEFLQRGIKNDTVMRFKCTCNPTIKKDGKRIPLNAVKTSNQPYCAEDWLKDRLHMNGAEVLDSRMIRFEMHKIKRSSKSINLVAAEYEGYLRVADADKFVKALTNGIGHGKAYGCGLISVART